MNALRTAATLALALGASLAFADQQAPASRAEVKAEVAQAKASGQTEPASTIETAPKVVHKKKIKPAKAAAKASDAS